MSETYATYDIFEDFYNEFDTHEEAVRCAHRYIDRKGEGENYEIRVIKVLDSWSSDDLLPGE